MENDFHLLSREMEFGILYESMQKFKYFQLLSEIDFYTYVQHLG